MNTGQTSQFPFYQKPSMYSPAGLELWRRSFLRVEGELALPWGAPLMRGSLLLCRVPVQITFREDVSCDLSLIIRNRFPSGARSQLMGPVRIPVSTMSVLNRACGMPAWKTG